MANPLLMRVGVFGRRPGFYWQVYPFAPLAGSNGDMVEGVAEFRTSPFFAKTAGSIRRRGLARELLTSRRTDSAG
jgi:hypothetical protein